MFPVARIIHFSAMRGAGLFLATALLALGATVVSPAATARDTVDCKSSGHQYNECRTPFRDPTLVNQLSVTQCVAGRNWGVRDGSGTVWVDKGCSGTFADRGRGGRGYDDRGYDNRGDGVECRSRSYAFARCDVPWDGARLVRQLSASDCDEGRDWGVDRNGLWVDNGCAGYFVEDRGGRRRYENSRRDNDIRIDIGGGSRSGGGSGSVVCESQGGARAQCRLPHGVYNVNLEVQLSQTKCRRGDNWDVFGRDLWVDRGCRGQFRYW